MLISIQMEKNAKKIKTDIEYLKKVEKQLSQQAKQLKTTKPEEIQMHVDEEEKLVEILCIENSFEISIKDNKYKITFKKTNACITAKERKVILIYKKKFLYIERKKEKFYIITNHNIQLNKNAKNFIKERDIIAFCIEGLKKINIEKNILTIKVKKVEKEIEKQVVLQDNNTLLISEDDDKVYLPYTAEEVLKQVSRSKGKLTIQDVIEEKYIYPASIYKNSIKSRYKEGYKLIREKERKSIRTAIMLGLELMFEFNLHPAIISACKNLEQLDIYLECLDDNELEKFTCFKIEYEAIPTVTKRKK